jgi:hypothetical protein
MTQPSRRHFMEAGQASTKRQGENDVYPDESDASNNMSFKGADCLLRSLFLGAGGGRETGVVRN